MSNAAKRTLRCPAAPRQDRPVLPPTLSPTILDRRETRRRLFMPDSPSRARRDLLSEFNEAAEPNGSDDEDAATASTQVSTSEESEQPASPPRVGFIQPSDMDVPEFPADFDLNTPWGH